MAGTITAIDTANGEIKVTNLETKKPMTRESLFRMASMTKPVIGTAAMMMLEEGKIQLGDPVSKYIPEFKNLKSLLFGINLRGMVNLKL